MVGVPNFVVDHLPIKLVIPPKKVVDMLEYLFGNPVIEKVLFFLTVNERCYPSQLREIFQSPRKINRDLIKCNSEWKILSMILKQKQQNDSSMGTSADYRASYGFTIN